MSKTKIESTINDNIYFLDEKKTNIEILLKDNDNKELFFIDTQENDVDLNIKIFLKNKNKINIIICCLNSKKYTKNINVYIKHNKNNSFSSCEVYTINKNTSVTNIDLLADINKNSLDNNCVQIIKGILLSNGSKIIGNPKLLIDSNNIKAKHSLAIGVLNRNHIFYLMSKGISSSVAKKLIIMSFFNKILNKILDEKHREEIYLNIYKKIGNI